MNNTISISTGLFNGMVFCRTADNVSDQQITGTCPMDGQVSFSVDNGEFQPCGTAAGGTFTARITGLPVRLDPYCLRLKIGEDVLEFPRIWVGDVWVLGGQSNMQGSADMAGVFINDNPAVRCYYMDDRWDLANDPTHVLPKANACVHWNLMGRTEIWKGPYTDPLDKGAGPTVSFGVEMVKATGIPQGLIACAHGGSNMDHWSQELLKDGDASLYGAMINRVKRNGGRISGILWYQGESDNIPERAPFFSGKMDRFLAALSRDLDAPKLPFFQVQLCRDCVIDNSEGWNTVRYAQLDLSRRYANVITIPTVDLEMGDIAHISTQGYRELGRRLAYAVCAYRNMPGYLPEIIPVSAKKDRLPRTNVEKITLEFANVSGSLKSTGRPTGFTISGQQVIPRLRLEGNKVIIFAPVGSTGTVEYAFGNNPYCNITDEAGRSLPAFQLPIELNYKTTGYPSQMRATDPVLMDDDVEALRFDQIPDDTGDDSLYYTQMSSDSFILCRNRLDTPHVPGFRFFRAKYNVKKPLKLTLLAGYDAPTAIFCDGVKLHANPNGLNPVIPSEYEIPLEWQPGTHEIIFAEVLHDGRAFGISLSIEASNDTPQEDMPVLLTP